MTSSQHAQFVVVTDRDVLLRYSVRSPDGQMHDANAERTSRIDMPMATDQVEVSGLAPKTDYELIVKDTQGNIWDRRTFRALDPETAHPHLAVASLAYGETSPPEMWTDLLARRPDVLLLIGRNRHADPSVPEWSRFAQTHGTAALFKANPLIPVIATWDHVEETQTFTAFFAQKTGSPGFAPPPGFVSGPGSAAWWEAFGINFAFLDNRESQEWLRPYLLAAQRPVFLINGSTVSAPGKKPPEFLKKCSAPLIFVSGNGTVDEILEVKGLGYPTFELTVRTPRSAHFQYLDLEISDLNRRHLRALVQSFDSDAQSNAQATLIIEKKQVEK